MERASVQLPDGSSLPIWRARGPDGAPTLMLVHGLGVTGWLNWGQVADALACDFDVITFDLRGHGQGPRAYRFQLEQCADDVAAVASALGVDSFFVAGYSMGGPIAKLCWRRHPHRVKGIVLAATSGDFAPHLGTRRLRLAMNVLQSLVVFRPTFVRRRVHAWAIYRLGHIIEPDRIVEELAGHRFSVILQAAQSLARFSSLAWAGEINVPVAVVVTSEDDRVHPESQRRLANAIGRAVIIETPGTHTAVITDADTFVPDLLEACRDVWRRSGADAISA